MTEFVDDVDTLVERHRHIVYCEGDEQERFKVWDNISGISYVRELGIGGGFMSEGTVLVQVTKKIPLVEEDALVNICHNLLPLHPHACTTPSQSLESA